MKIEMCYFENKVDRILGNYLVIVTSLKFFKTEIFDSIFETEILESKTLERNMSILKKKKFFFKF